jgi:hypothetical protein
MPAQRPFLTQSAEWPREGSNQPANRHRFAAEVCTGVCTASHESHVFTRFHVGEERCVVDFDLVEQDVLSGDIRSYRTQSWSNRSLDSGFSW